MVGSFSVKEMMNFLGLEMSRYTNHMAVVEAMDKCLGVTKIELKKDEKGEYSAEYSKEAKADKESW